MSALRVVMAAAEAAPVARVGGLAEAVAGLARALQRSDDVDLTLLLPDYGDVELANERIEPLEVPGWVGSATLRTGIADELGEITLIRVPGIERPHPYVDETGSGWSDNDHRFFAFSAAVAAAVERIDPDVVHLNDWHTAIAAGMISHPLVYTIHTLGYQGHTDLGWLDVLGLDVRGAPFVRGDHLNPAAGAIALADRVVAVSPNYAKEILDPFRSEGLHDVLVEKGERLVGIRNGIDTELWNPMTDQTLLSVYGRSSLAKKKDTTTALLDRAGWSAGSGPLMAMVTRLVDQKGIDLLLGLVPYFARLELRLFVLGSGEERLARWARELAEQHPDHLHFVEGYDVELARQLFAGADLFAMPSRFEPCGLAQMQAMQYGTIPVVTPVGGLVDTVIDADDHPDDGNGFVADAVDATALLDAIHRAVAAWRTTSRRQKIQRNGMAADWSWDQPMERYLDLYRSANDSPSTTQR